MRLYLDQMFRIELADLLSQEGYDVVRASDVGQSTAADDVILATAVAQSRTLVTLDEHFGNWAILPLDTHPGVIRLKINPATTTNAWNLLSVFLAVHVQPEFENHLIILSSSSERWIATAKP